MRDVDAEGDTENLRMLSSSDAGGGSGARFLLHVGYPKAASSWLQEIVFADRAAGFCQPFARRATTELIVSPNALDFDAKRVSAELDDALSDPANEALVPVLSSERLVGSSHSGGHDSKELANRVRALFPDARIVIVIREQRDMIASTYNQYVRRGGPCTLPEYLFPNGDLRVPLFDLAHFAYHRLIRYYQELYGVDDVLVLSVEELKEDSASFLARLTQFAGTRQASSLADERVNEGSSPFLLALKRRLHVLAGRSTLNPHVNLARTRVIGRFRRTPLVDQLLSRQRQTVSDSYEREETGDPPRLEQVIDRMVPSSVQSRIDRRLRRQISELVNDYYRESNRRTKQLSGLPLDRWGYVV